ncbi:unnamed protein product [Effrenium voratum]|nr:unnamed protein product [Effrenium voratum]
MGSTGIEPLFQTGTAWRVASPTLSQDELGLERRKRRDHFDKSRKWKTEQACKGRKSGRANVVVGAEVLEKARSSEVRKRQRWALHLVDHDYFDWVLVVCLLANAATFGWQANVMAGELKMGTPVVFTVINITFCVAFTLELVLRLYAHQMQFFIGEMAGPGTSSMVLWFSSASWTSSPSCCWSRTPACSASPVCCGCCAWAACCAWCA